MIQCLGMADFHIRGIETGQLEPAGLNYCRQNGLGTEYSSENWTIIKDSDHHEELLIVGNTVIWTIAGILKRAFGFEEEEQTVRHALFVLFPSSEQQPGEVQSQRSLQLGVNTQSQSRVSALNRAFKSTANVVHADPRLSDSSDNERALVVILDELAYIYYLDGRRDIVNMPFKVRKAAAATPTGIVLERLLDIDEFPVRYRDRADQIPKFFFLPEPLAELGLMAGTSGTLKMPKCDDEMCYLDGSFFVTYSPRRQKISIWSISRRSDTQPAHHSSSLTGGHTRRRSSMRSSVVNVLRQEDSEEDRRTASTRTDSVLLDRMVSTEIDTAVLFNESGALRRDFELEHLESLPLICADRGPDVFTLRRSVSTLVLCLHSASEQVLVELLVRKLNQARPKLVKSSRLSCSNAIPLSLHGEEFVLVQDTAQVLYLRAPMSPDIIVQPQPRTTRITQYRKSEFAGLDAEGSLRKIILEPGLTDPSIKHFLQGLQAVMHMQHYRYLLAVLIDARYRMGAQAELDIFASTIFAIFLKPTSSQLDVPQDHEDADYLVFSWISLAHTTCRLHDLTVLQGYLPQVLLSIHFVSEEMALDCLSRHHRAAILPLLIQLANWLGWEGYVEYYGSQITLSTNLALDDPLEHLKFPMPSDGPPSFFRWARALLSGEKQRMQTIELLSPAHKDSNNPYQPKQISTRSVCPVTLALAKIYEALVVYSKSLHEFIEAISSLHFSLDDLERLPQAVATPIREAIAHCASNPLPHWSIEILIFIGRQDLVDFVSTRRHRSSIHASEEVNVVALASSEAGNDSYEKVELASADKLTKSEHDPIGHLIFHEDRRLQEISRMLKCHKTTSVQFVINEQLGEAEQLRQQQSFAVSVAKRTMAVPIGRGLLGYNLRTPLPTQKFPLAKLNFDVKLRPAQITVNEDKTILTPTVKSWCQFHNGVAAGLSVSQDSKEISASWIVYNKPEELTNGHAGFLLGLGLNGHLKAIATWHAFNYLTSKHTMTSIGLLLGLSASFIGSVEPMITKLLSVHILALLPPGSNELNLSGITQAAGVVGIGLLHYQTGHRRMSEVMLKEISNADNSNDHFRDEGYRLAAGLSLGIINVGNGGSRQGSRHMNFLRLLVDCVQGFDREADDLDVKMPGAIIALGLMYLKTENRYVADRLSVPSTQHEIHFFRPDLYLLRTLACGLIMWNELQPELGYVQSLLPPVWRARADLEGITWHNVDDLVLFNVIVGACLAMGIKNAGTLNIRARDFILQYLDKFIALSDIKATGVDQESNVIAGRTFLGVLAYASSMIMAGSGDLEVLRRLRRLHYRLHSESTYGDYVAVEMSIGLLFLGGGRSSLHRSNIAICSYVAAFYPILPSSTNDNRSHLQALRHLWVLGAEPRCIIPRESGKSQACLASIRIILRDPDLGHIDCTAPCLLPPLETVASINTIGDEYWPVSLDFQSSQDHLTAFRRNQTIYVKRKDADHKPLAFNPDDKDSESSSTAKVIASMVGSSLPDGSEHLTKLLERALSSPDTRHSQILLIRMSLTACVNNPKDRTKLDEVRLVLAYWESTQHGALKAKFSNCERMLDVEFIEQLRLDLWRLISDSGEGA